MTNREFSKQNEAFQLACELGKVPVTIRQASKYRNKQGTAYRFRKEAERKLENEKKEE